MRLTAVLGAVALIAAIAASAALYLVPHPTQPVTQTMTTPPPAGEIVTYGQAGEVSPEEAREILFGSRRAELPLFPVVKAGYLGVPEGAPITAPVMTPEASLGGGGYEYTQTNVQVPGVDEGDILKLAPPHGLYLARGRLYLLRLWPPENLSIIDESALSSIVYDAISSGVINASTDDFGISAGGGQILVVGDTAVVAFTYQVIPSGPQYSCTSNETLNVTISGHEFTFVVPRCYPAPSLWGTIVATYRFGDEGLQLVGYHVLSGLRLIESRLSDGVVYLFTMPYTWVPTGEEGVDGVGVLEAGPTYVVGTPGMVNTLVTIAAIRPGTGEVGVTNVILPAEAVAGNVIVYMREGTAYLITRGMAPPVTAEDIAKAIRACADKAPDDLRQRLEALGPDASPDDVLAAIKAWGEGVKKELAPLVEWVHDITGGIIMAYPTMIGWDEELTLPENLSELLSSIHKEMDAMGEFSECVSEELGNLSAASTSIVKVVFSGLSGAVTASAKVPGTVYDRFAVHEDGNYLYIVTTEELGRAYLLPQTLPRIVIGAPYGPYPEGEAKIPFWVLITEVFGSIESLDYLENMSDLTDLVIVVPVWGQPTGSSLYVLNASDLTQVSSLTGIAPGERVYAARYAGNYLYLVTFRRVDPLFGIDVSDPTNPRVLGWLEIPGYSEYLHPWGDKYLVGVGVGESWGLKVDLYDVSDPANITRVSSVEVSGWSQALWEHHAFQPIDNQTFAIPVMFSDKGTGIAVFRVMPDEGLKYLGTVGVEGPQRSARINDVLYAFGRNSVVAASFPDLGVIAQIRLSEEGVHPGVTTVTVVETSTPG